MRDHARSSYSGELANSDLQEQGGHFIVKGNTLAGPGLGWYPSIVMPVSKQTISRNLERIRENIREACQKAGRDEGDVRLIAVTKAVDVDTLKKCIELGLTELGENRAPQLAERFEEIDTWMQKTRKTLPGPLRWHMIGHMQRNKVKVALKAADVIHSVDSLRLAEEINSRAERDERVVDVMLQVNCSGEDQKYGCAVGAATHMCETICTLRNLRLVGLMTMAALTDEPEDARPAFARLREVFEDIKHEKIGGDSFRELSMGMSHDYTVAVEEGATMLRIGSALFEEAE